MFSLEQLMNSLGKVALIRKKVEFYDSVLYYHSVNIYIPQTNIYAHTLYLAEAAELPRDLAESKDVGCILIHPPEGTGVPTIPAGIQCEWVLWDEPVSLIKLFNKIQNLISLDMNRNDFRTFLFSALNDGIGIESFIHQAALWVQNPIMVTDAAFRLISMDDCGCKVNDPFWMELQGSGVLSAESVRLLRQMGITALTEYARGPTIYNDTTLPSMGNTGMPATPRIARKLYSPQGEFLGIVAIYQGRHALTSEDYVFIDRLGATLALKLRYQPYVTEEQRLCASVIRKLLEGREYGDMALEEQHMHDQIAKAVWLCICYVNLVSDPATARQGEYFRSYLFSDMPNVHTIRYHKDIVALVCSEDHEDLSSKINEIKTRLKKTDLHMGVSRRYQLLSLSGPMFREAKISLALGIRYCRDKKLFRYEDVAIYQLLENTAPEALKDYYGSSAHALLREYDQRKGTEFCHTFVQFAASGGNNAKTAAELHIHKNTLAYRLTKIYAITGLDMEQETVLHDFYFNDIIYHYLSFIQSKV